MNHSPPLRAVSAAAAAKPHISPVIQQLQQVSLPTPEQVPPRAHSLWPHPPLLPKFGDGHVVFRDYKNS